MRDPEPKSDLLIFLLVAAGLSIAQTWKDLQGASMDLQY